MIVPAGAAATLARPVSTRVAVLAAHGGHAGGAAIAMERMVSGMRRCGAIVDVVTRAAVGTGRLPGERRVRRIVTRSRTAASNTLFTLDWPTWDVLAHPAVAAADVVNVHWVAGFLGAESIRRIVTAGKPVLWTMHDMRPFTGGCHYASGCEGFTTGCGSCPQVDESIHDAPRRAAAAARRRLGGVPITFVAPSRWLAGELLRSSLHDPEAHAVAVVPNGLDLDRHTPAPDKAAARRRLSLPERGLGILIGSVSLDERRKGGREAAAALAALAAWTAADPPPFVVTYGAAAPAIDGLVTRHLGPCDEAGVIAALHASDVHLTMTREDNLPNTVIEAMACGVPVLGTAVGGLPEMITDGLDGWLVPRDDAAAAAGILVRLAADPAAAPAAGREARRRAVADWDDRRAAMRYLDLAAALVRAGAAREATGGVHVLRPSAAVAGLIGRRIPFRSPRRPPWSSRREEAA
ncbi:MAG: glycosyltransferase [Planctomycetaceae bacterium]